MHCLRTDVQAEYINILFMARRRCLVVLAAESRFFAERFPHILLDERLLFGLRYRKPGDVDELFEGALTCYRYI